MANCKQMLIGGGRIGYVDTAKVIGTFLVVFAHMYKVESPERLYIYAFHMPFFFFVSGLFFKPIPIKEEIKKSIKKLIIPAFIYIIISVLIETIFFNESILLLTKGCLVGIIRGGQIEANNITWFFFALANVRILASIWYNKKKLFVSIIFVILLLFAIKRIPFFFIMQGVIALPFYLIAYYSREIINDEMIKDRGWKRIIISIFLLIATVIMSNLNGYTGVLVFWFGDLPYGIKYIVFYANALIGSLLILNTAVLFNNTNRVIKKAALALLTVVGLQRIPIDIFVSHYGTDSPYIYSIPCSIFIIAFCVICHKPISKLFPK